MLLWMEPRLTILLRRRRKQRQAIPIWTTCWTFKNKSSILFFFSMTFHDDRKQLNLFRRIYILLQLRYQRLLTVAQSSALRKWCKVLGIVITVALISCAGLLWWKTNLYSESTEFPYARPDQYRLYWPYKEPPMYTFSWTYPKDEEEEVGFNFLFQNSFAITFKDE